MTDPAQRSKPWTGNPFAGRLKMSRDAYERGMRALGKEPNQPGHKPPSTGAGSHD